MTIEEGLQQTRNSKKFIVVLTRTGAITAAHTLEMMQAYRSLHALCRFRLGTIAETMGGVICNPHSRDSVLRGKSGKDT